MDDLSIMCYTETHSLYQVLGAVGVLTYALGIPLAFLGEAALTAFSSTPLARWETVSLG